MAIRATDALNSSLHIWQQYAVITAMDLHSSGLLAACFVERRGVVDKSRDPLKNPPPPGRVTDGGAVNLFTCLGIPNRAGEYLVTTLLLDKTSNRLRIKVEPSGFDGDRAKVDKASRKRRSARDSQAGPLAAEKLLSLDQEAESPPIPDDPGIALRVVQLAAKEKGKAGAVIAFGSYRLPSHLAPDMSAKRTF